MNAKVVGIAAGLLIVIAAAWWLRAGSGSRSGSESHGQVATSELDRSKVARSEPSPSPAPARAPKSQPNGSSAPSAALQAPKAAPPVDDPRRKREYEFLERLFMPPGPQASDADRLAWSQSPMSSLVYPAGHPCEGLPTDTASVEALVAAAARPEFFDNFFEADRPQVLLEGQKDFFPLNQCAKTLNRENPESVEQFITCFSSLPENPKAYPATVWLPVSADHPGATTMRAHMTEMIRGYATRLMAGPRCPS